MSDVTPQSLNESKVHVVVWLLKLNYMTEYVTTRQEAAAWLSGRFESRRMCFECRLLRNAERGAVWQSGLGSVKNTLCWFKNSFSGSTTERPHCSVHHPLFASVLNVLFLSPCLLFPTPFISSFPVFSPLFILFPFLLFCSLPILFSACLLTSPSTCKLQPNTCKNLDTVPHRCFRLTKVLEALRVVQMSTYLMKKSPEERNTTYMQCCFE